jgi:hypothetical protein
VSRCPPAIPIPAVYSKKCAGKITSECCSSWFDLEEKQAAGEQFFTVDEAP